MSLEALLYMSTHISLANTVLNYVSQKVMHVYNHLQVDVEYSNKRKFSRRKIECNWDRYKEDNLGIIKMFLLTLKLHLFVH